MKRSVILALLALLACKPEPGGSEVTMSSEPTLIVERSGEAVACDLVGEDTTTYEIREHADWLGLWIDRALDTEGERPPADAAEARARACAMTQGFDESLGCTKGGRQLLALQTDGEVSILLVEERAEGVRSIELSRWPEMCRCDCGSSVELLSRDPLVVSVAEYESVAGEFHLEDETIVDGCDEDDEDCMTACVGEIYGRQRVLVFGDSLALHAGYFDDSARDGGEFAVRFEIDQGRLVANGECTQVLSD